MNRFITPQALAADILKELEAHPKRWCQFRFNDDQNPEKPCCLIGHVWKRVQSTQDPVFNQTYNALREAVGFSEEGSLMFWNDFPGRTLNDVLNALRKVATS